MYKYGMVENQANRNKCDRLRDNFENLGKLEMGKDVCKLSDRQI